MTLLNSLIHKKTIATLVSILSIIGYGVFVFAVGPFAPGTELDPACSPYINNDPLQGVDTDCTVIIGGGAGWSLTGDVGTDDTLNFIGTTDAQDFVIRANNAEIGRFGVNGGVSLGSGMPQDYLFPGFPPTDLPAPLASGDFSFATGVNAIASGFSSIALGLNSNAIGNGSLVIGTGFLASDASYADNDASLAFGLGVRSYSAAETTLGFFNTAYNHTGGTSNRSLEDRLFVIGNGIHANARNNAYTMWKDGSFAYNDDNFQNDNPGTEQNMFYFNYGNHDGLGNVSVIKAIRLGSVDNDAWDLSSGNVGSKSIAIGFSATDIDPSFTAPIASGLGSIAIGFGSSVSGSGAIAIGDSNNLEGLNAFIFGTLNSIYNTNDFAFGEGNIITAGSNGDNYAFGEENIITNIIGDSYAFGVTNLVASDGAFAFGRANTSSGENAFAFGRANTSSGENAFAIGNNNEALSHSGFAIGNNATAYGISEMVFGQTTSYTPGAFAFGRAFAFGFGGKDMLTIIKNGQTGIAIDNFEANTNGNIFQVGDGTTNIIGYVDDITGNWMNVSDARKKKNIQNLTYGLDTINQLSPKSFDYIRNNESSIGFLAQDVLAIVPEAVSGNEDIGYGMSYATLTPVLVKAIQELDLKIQNIQSASSTVVVSSGFSLDTLRTWLGDVGNGIQKIVASVIQGNTIRAKDQLCVGDTCISESEFIELLNNRSVDPIQTNNSYPDNDSSDNDENQEIISDNSESNDSEEITQEDTLDPTLETEEESQSDIDSSYDEITP